MSFSSLCGTISFRGFFWVQFAFLSVSLSLTVWHSNTQRHVEGCLDHMQALWFGLALCLLCVCVFEHGLCCTAATGVTVQAAVLLAKDGPHCWTQEHFVLHKLVTFTLGSRLICWTCCTHMEVLSFQMTDRLCCRCIAFMRWVYSSIDCVSVNLLLPPSLWCIIMKDESQIFHQYSCFNSNQVISLCTWEAQTDTRKSV